MKSDPVSLAICGAAGRMGQSLIEVVRDSPEFNLSAALVRADSPLLGTPVWPSGEVTFTTGLAGSCKRGVLIDFSGSTGFDSALRMAEAEGLAFVSGSTGLDARQLDELARASETIAVMWSANFSIGVAVLAHLATVAARVLPDWDCEIFEAHHRHKQDAPSGTALLLGQRVNAAREIAQTRLPADRSGSRPSGSVGYAVMRGGDIIGEHELRLMGAGERLELVHRATDRRLFARGALRAARWLHGKTPGRYDLNDVLGIHA